MRAACRLLEAAGDAGSRDRFTSTADALSRRHGR